MRDLVLALCPSIPGEAIDLAPIHAARAAVKGRDGSIVAIVVGGNEEAVQAALASGAPVAWSVSHPDLSPLGDAGQLAQVFGEALADPALRDFRLALLPAGSLGASLAAALAARFEAAVLGTCSDFALTTSGVVARRAAFGGRAEMTIGTEGKCFATTRQAGKAERTNAGNDIRRLWLTTPLPASLDIAWGESAAPACSVTGARVVISGGRGIGGEDGFSRLRDLAACLDGAVGGSLPTVDAGWAPVLAQVGQSGAFVTPEIYVAVGISGTPQHLAGIGSNARIVAINNDADAQIFRFAEIGVVADWEDVLPDLVRRLRGPR